MELSKIGLKKEEIARILDVDLKALGGKEPKDISHTQAKMLLGQAYNKLLTEQLKTLDGQLGENPISKDLQRAADGILREYAQYKLDTEEIAYMNGYVKDYIRFQKEQKGSTKSDEELAHEASEIYLMQAPDYMRLTENIMRIAQEQPGDNPANLRGVLRERGGDLIEYYKESKNVGKVKAILAACGVENSDLVDLANLVKGIEPSALEKFKENGKELTHEELLAKYVLKEKLGKEIPEDFLKIARSEEARTQYDMMRDFGVDDKLLDISPALLKDPEKVADIVHAIRSEWLFNWAEKLIDTVSRDPELKQAFQQNPQLAGEVAIGIIKNNPFLKNICDDFGCSKEVLEIITELIKTPEEAAEILREMNKGNYSSLVTKALQLITDKPDLQKYMEQNGGAYAKLVSILFEKIEPMKNLVEGYGLDKSQVDLITGMIPHLLHDTKKFNTLYEHLNKGEDIEMIKHLNEWAKTNEGLKNYLETNKERYEELIFTIFKNLDQTKDLQKQYGLSDEEVKVIVGVMPHLLHDTKKFEEIYDKFQKEKYGDIAKLLNEWAKTNEGLKGYLRGNSDSLGGIINKVVAKSTVANDYIKEYTSELDLDIQELASAIISHEHLLGSDNLDQFMEGIKKPSPVLLISSIYNVIDDPKISNILEKAFGKENKDLIVKLSKLLNETPELKVAVEKYNKGEIGVLDLAKTFLGNEKVQTFLTENKEQVGAFVKLLTEKIPTLRKMKLDYLGQVKIDDFVTGVINSGMINSKDGVQAILGAFSEGGWKQFATYAYRIPTLLWVIKELPILQYRSSPKLSGDINQQVQERVDGHQGVRINLSELLEGVVERKELSGANLEQVKFQDLVVDGFNFTQSKFQVAQFVNSEIENTLFKGADFSDGVTFENVNLFNVDFSECSFSGSKDTNRGIFDPSGISFKNCNLKKVNFEGIKFPHAGVDKHFSDQINFEGSTIDAYTLQSIANAIHKNPELKDKFNLKGAKIVGDLSELDLRDMDLSVADFSQVSSMRGVQLAGADITGAQIDGGLLQEAMGTSQLKHDRGDMGEILREQQEKRKDIIVNKLAKNIIAKLDKDGELTIAEDRPYSSYVDEFKKKLKKDFATLDPKMQEYVYGMLEENYQNLGNFNIDTKGMKNFSDVKDKSGILLYALLQEKSGNPEVNLGELLRDECLKNLLADAIGKELFGEGKSRGQDLLIIRDHLSKTFDQLSKEEKGKLCEELLDVDKGEAKLKNSEQLVGNLKDRYYKKASYTAAGKVSGGIQFAADALNGLEAEDLKDFRGVKGVNKEQEDRNRIAEEIGGKIAVELFGEDMSAARGKDRDKIINFIKNRVLPDLGDIQNINVDDIVGRVGQGPKSSSGLSKIIYDEATSWTKAGWMSSGVQLNESKLTGDLVVKLRDKTKSHIREMSPDRSM
ncbi:MAG: hypothetical protein ACI8ZF_000051 [Candidatus Midichloriaceae bacterium]